MSDWNAFIVQEQISNERVDFKPIYVDMAGDLVTGLLLSQIVYWHLPTKGGDSKLKVKKDGYYWIAKKYTDWYAECRITERQARRAVEILEEKGILISKVYGFAGAPTTHLRIVQEEFLSRWSACVAERVAKQEADETSKSTKCQAATRRNVSLAAEETDETSGSNTETTCSKNTTETGANDAPNIEDGLLPTNRAKKGTEKRTREDIFEKDLVSRFTAITRLTPAGSDLYIRWLNPAREMLERTEWDIEKTEALIHVTLREMRKGGMHFDSPQSLIRMFRSILSQETAPVRSGMKAW